MSDPLTPPPRRPAPAHLRNQLLIELGEERAPRTRLRFLAVPLVLALVAAVLFAVLQPGGLVSVQPVTTASPAPTTPSQAAQTSRTPSTEPTSTPGPSTATDQPTPVAPPSIDVRPMSRSEIAADTKSCFASADGYGDAPPRRGTPAVVFAMVQLLGGPRGPESRQIRVLVTADEKGVWSCENGVEASWAEGKMAKLSTRATPAVEVGDFSAVRASCSGDAVESTGSRLYAVGDQVAMGRVRVSHGKTQGPWQTSVPKLGYVHFSYGVTEKDTLWSSVTAEIEFLDARGRLLTIQPYGEPGTRSRTTDGENLISCEGRPDIPTPKALTPPASDRAGVTTCLAMGRDSAEQDGDSFGSGWTAKLVISTADAWGAVLSNGSRRFGCSLFPTKEISPIAADTTTVSRSAFYFALNPIEVPEGSSLWAAGRLPTDVTKVSYRLPAQTVAATLGADGYWMMMYHVVGRDIDTEPNVNDWDPVAVSVTRPSGIRVFTLGFTEESMCHQVSHGC